MDSSQKLTELYTQTINIYLEIPMEYFEYNVLSTIIKEHVKKNKYSKFNPFTVVLKAFKTHRYDILKKIRYVIDITNDLYEIHKSKKGQHLSILNVYSTKNSVKFLRLVLNNYRCKELLKVFDYYITKYLSKYNNTDLYSLRLVSNNWGDVVKVLPHIGFVLKKKFNIYTNEMKSNFYSFLNRLNCNFISIHDFRYYLIDKLIEHDSIFVYRDEVVKLLFNITYPHEYSLLTDKYFKYCPYYVQLSLVNMYPHFISKFSLLDQNIIASSNPAKYFIHCDLDVQKSLINI